MTQAVSKNTEPSIVHDTHTKNPRTGHIPKTGVQMRPYLAKGTSRESEIFCTYTSYSAIVSLKISWSHTEPFDCYESPNIGKSHHFRQVGLIITYD